MSTPNGTWNNLVVGIVGVLIAAGVLASIGSNMKVAGVLGGLVAEVGSLKTSVGGLAEDVSEIRSEQWRRAESRYTKEDAERAQDRINARLLDLERRG